MYMVRENGPEKKDEKEAGAYPKKYSESQNRKPWTSVINQQGSQDLPPQRKPFVIVLGGEGEEKVVQSRNRYKFVSWTDLRERGLAEAVDVSKNMIEFGNGRKKRQG